MSAPVPESPCPESPCELLRARVQDALDARSPLSSDLEAHLAACPPCEAEARLLQGLDALLASEPVATVPPGLSLGVMGLVREDAARSRRRARLVARASVAALVALAVGLEALGIDLLASAAAVGREAQRFALSAAAEAPGLPGRVGLELDPGALRGLWPAERFAGLARASLSPASLAPIAIVLAALVLGAQLAWARSGGLEGGRS